MTNTDSVRHSGNNTESKKDIAMSDAPESQCPTCEKLRERIRELETETEKLRRTQKGWLLGICVLVALIVVNFMLTIASR